MKRREFITLMSGAAVWPLTARAQRQPTNIPRIGIIDDAPIWDHFRQGLSQLGYVEGRDVVFEYRSGQGQPDRLAGGASELAKLPVDVIVTSGSAATQAAKEATTTIPIVMIAIGDPVRAGLVRSLAQPGGNITGNTLLGSETLLCLDPMAAPHSRPLGVSCRELPRICPARLPHYPLQTILR